MPDLSIFSGLPSAVTTSDRTKIRLVVGLGNPGKEYELTRHNAGVWFVHKLAFFFGLNLKEFKFESKFQGEVAKIINFKKLSESESSDDIRLLIPMTFMNLSGHAVQALAKFYKINISEILVVHDDIDLEPGRLKLKQGGGDGGQRGVRHIMQTCGADFWRLRVGVGSPNSAGSINKSHPDAVANYVLHAPSKSEKILIEDCIDRAIADIALIFTGQTDLFMNKHHG